MLEVERSVSQETDRPVKTITTSREGVWIFILRPGKITGIFLLISLAFHFALLAALASLAHYQYPEKKQKLFSVSTAALMPSPSPYPSPQGEREALLNSSSPRTRGVLLNSSPPLLKGAGGITNGSRRIQNKIATIYLNPSLKGKGSSFNPSLRQKMDKPDISSQGIRNEDKPQKRMQVSYKLLSEKGAAFLPSAAPADEGPGSRPEGKSSEKTGSNKSGTAGGSESALQAPVKLSCPEPPYPESAIDEEREGIVRLKAFILESGRVKEVVLLVSSGYSDFDRAATEAVKNWLFDPAKKNGKEISAWVDLAVSFRLKH